ncbi:MAG: response regulator [Parafilimonas sp.]
MANIKPTILMADDDYEDLELIEEAITAIKPDASLHKVINGKAVIDFLSHQPDNELPCLIVLDYNMPELTGLEVLCLMRKNLRYEKIPKVMLSTSNTPFHVRECIKNGAMEYFVKPTNMTDLIAVAQKMLMYCKS